MPVQGDYIWAVNSCFLVLQKASIKNEYLLSVHVPDYDITGFIASGQYAWLHEWKPHAWDSLQSVKNEYPFIFTCFSKNCNYPGTSAKLYTVINPSYEAAARY